MSYGNMDEEIKKYQAFIKQSESTLGKLSSFMKEFGKNGVKFIEKIQKSFDEFVGSSVLVAHNLEFDLKFIFYSGSHVMETKRKYIDTLGQARRIIKKDEVFDYKLESLCDLYFITNARAHSALSDAEACGELFFALVSEVQN